MELDLQLHVVCDDQQSEGMYGKVLRAPKEAVPMEGDLMSFFEGMELAGYIGYPASEVIHRCWSADLQRLEFHIDCVVQTDFFFDRPWRQHLVATGWKQLEESGEERVTA